MKLTTILIACLLSSSAKADTFVVAAQWDTTNSWYVGCDAAKKSAIANGTPDVWACEYIPIGQTVRQCSGTFSVKQDGIEVLVHIMAGGDPSLPYIGTILWQGRIAGRPSGDNTVSFITPDFYKNNGQPQSPYVTGNGSTKVWVEQSTYAPGVSTPPGGASEIQATCSTQ